MFWAKIKQYIHKFPFRFIQICFLLFIVIASTYKYSNDRKQAKIDAAYNYQQDLLASNDNYDDINEKIAGGDTSLWLYKYSRDERSVWKGKDDSLYKKWATLAAIYEKRCHADTLSNYSLAMVANGKYLDFHFRLDSLLSHGDTSVAAYKLAIEVVRSFIDYQEYISDDDMDYSEMSVAISRALRIRKSLMRRGIDSNFLTSYFKIPISPYAH